MLQTSHRVQELADFRLTQHVWQSIGLSAGGDVVRDDPVPLQGDGVEEPQSGETVPNMGAIMLPCEMSGDAGKCRGDPGRTCR